MSPGGNPKTREGANQNPLWIFVMVGDGSLAGLFLLSQNQP